MPGAGIEESGMGWESPPAPLGRHVRSQARPIPARRFGILVSHGAGVTDCRPTLSSDSSQGSGDLQCRTEERNFLFPSLRFLFGGDVVLPPLGGAKELAPGVPKRLPGHQPRCRCRCSARARSRACAGFFGEASWTATWRATSCACPSCPRNTARRAPLAVASDQHSRCGGRIICVRVPSATRDVEVGSATDANAQALIGRSGADHGAFGTIGRSNHLVEVFSAGVSVVTMASLVMHARCPPKESGLEWHRRAWRALPRWGTHPVANLVACAVGTVANLAARLLH